MSKTGHDKNAPSESLSDTEQNFLKRYSLKKVTVPKEKLKDIVNLTVRRDEDDLTEWLNPKYKIPKNATVRKCERLEYRDLSKVIRSNVPWWLGTRGALNNLSGQRLASLVEVTDEERSFKNQRLEAGVEKNFRKMDSKGSVDVAEILSKGMEVCLMDNGRGVQKPMNVVPPHSSKQRRETKVTKKHAGNYKSENTNESMGISKILADSENKTKENKAGIRGLSNSGNSTDMAWIEERLDRVQQLLMSLEDLRLQSGCEKCQGKSMGYGNQDDDCDSPNDHGYVGANGEHSNVAANGQGRRTSFRGMNAVDYNEDLVKGSSDAYDSVLEAKICKCDLEIIDKEMTDLYCFLEELSEKQTSPKDKLQYEIIMCRVLEIRQCFCNFTNKILQNAQSTAQDVTAEEVPNVSNFIQQPEQTENRGSLGDFGSSSNAACGCNGRQGRKDGCLAAGPMFLDPPEAWCAQIKQDADANNCAKMVFVPCFYYNPTTGECKFTESDNQEYKTQITCNCQKDQNSAPQCCCWTCEPSKDNVVLKKKFPLNLSELVSQISVIQGKEAPKDKVPEKGTKDKDKAKENKTEKKKEKEKQAAKAENDENNSSQGETKTDVTVKSKLPVPQQNFGRPSTNRSVGKMLLQNMTIETQTDKCCCLQESEDTAQQNPEDARFTCCPSRSKGSGLDEAHMNDISSEPVKKSNEDCQTSISQTIVKIETVCCPANDEPNEQLPKRVNKQESQGQSSQEIPRNSIQETPKRSNQETPRRSSQDTTRRSSLESPKRSSQDTTRRPSQETSRRPSQETSRRPNQETPRRSIHETPRRTSQDVPRRSSQEAPRRTNQEPLVKLSLPSQNKPKLEPSSRSNLAQSDRVTQESKSRLKNEPSTMPTADAQIKQVKQQPSQLTIKVSLQDSSNGTKRALSGEPAIKSMRPSVTFKSQPTQELGKGAVQNSTEKRSEDLSQKLKDVCKILCDSSFKKLSDSCKNVYENPNDPTKQMCDIPCKTLCDLCKKSCNGAIDKFNSNITDTTDHSETVGPSKETENSIEKPITQFKPVEKQGGECEELLKNYEIFKNYVKPILDSNKTERVGNIDVSVHQSLSRMGFMPDRPLPKHAPLPARQCTCNMNFSQKFQDTDGSIIDENSDSVVTVKSACGGDAPQSPNCQCCCCEGVPPIEIGLGNIIQSRIKNRKRGTVYLKFTMSPNNLFHIQMATVNNEFLGCFYATETAVMEARRNNGFDGCITLSVMEPSNSPSQINRLVDHAFMVVQQDRKSKP